MATHSLPLNRADEIVITSLVLARPNKPADLKREARAFHGISAAIVADPATAVQRFLDVAMDLCDGDAAGLSLPQDDGAGPQFEWAALAGVYADFVGGRVPRDHSPCGLARKKGQTIVVSQPGRVFPEFAAVDPLISEGLIVPFYDNGGIFLGTIWVAHTRTGKHFCSNDLRVMEQLAVQMVLALKLAREQADIQSMRRMLDPATSIAANDPAVTGWSDGTGLRAEFAEFVEASAFRETVLASSGDCIKVLDLGARIRFMNQGGQRLMEVDDIEHVIGLPWFETWEGAEAVLAREAFDTAREGAAARFRGPAATFAGTMKHWDVQLSPIRRQDGSVGHILVTSRDVTEQRRLEEQRELLASELDHRVKNILAVVGAIACGFRDHRAQHSGMMAITVPT